MNKNIFEETIYGWTLFIHVRKTERLIVNFMNTITTSSRTKWSSVDFHIIM